MPAAGDVHWVEFDPMLGTEQAGRRPALVLTDDDYHLRAKRALVCPITRSAREWTFHVPIPAGHRVAGSVMADQLRMVDRDARIFGYIDTLPPDVLARVRGLLAALIGIR